VISPDSWRRIGARHPEAFQPSRHLAPFVGRGSFQESGGKLGPNPAWTLGFQLAPSPQGHAANFTSPFRQVLKRPTVGAASGQDAFGGLTGAEPLNWRRTR